MVVWNILVAALLVQTVGGFQPMGAASGCYKQKNFRICSSPESDVEDQSVSDSVLESLQGKLSENQDDSPQAKKDNKAMAFLRRMGKVGGAANKNFVNAVGSDEGSTGRQPAAERQSMKKSKSAYVECTVSGVIDDLSEAFPRTSCGTEWRGLSDRVMGGVSNGRLERIEDVQGRKANVLTGEVSLKNNGGFLQLVTDLALDPAKTNEGVDASEYDGIELDVLCRNEKMEVADDEETYFRPQNVNIHVRTPGTFQQSSFRYTCVIDEPNEWTKIRVPFSSFVGYGPGADGRQLDISALRRIGIVAIGEAMKVSIAVNGLKFYSVI